MDDNIINYQAEIDRLTIKCDKQLDYINEQEKQLVKQKEMIEQLEKQHSYIVESKDNIEAPGMNHFILVFRVFYQVVNEAIKTNTFFENKRSTENSRKYSVIDFRILSSYIEHFNNVYSVKKIMKIWADIGLIYQDESGSYFVNFTYEKKSIRSVRVNKAAVSIVKECIIYD